MSEDKRCGTCRWWDGEQAKYDWCLFQLPPLPISLKGDKETTHRDEGRYCPTWAGKEKG